MSMVYDRYDSVFKFKQLLHIVHVRRRGDVCQAALLPCLPALAGDEKDGIAVFLFQKSRDLLHASQNFRIAVGKERKSQLKCRLEDAAVNFL